MKRETLYIIGRKTFEDQKVGNIMNIHLADTETHVGDGWFHKYYEVLFGVDAKGRRYMALATQETGVSSHGAHFSGGHWHGRGSTFYTMGYSIKLRKNFKDADEANKYYNIVKANMYCRTVQDDEDDRRKFTEAQITEFFK